jgi:hypothetical protein
MSGAFTDAGTFTDDVTYTPDGVYTVVRTLHAARGTVDAVAMATAFLTGQFFSSTVTLHGTRRFAGGTGAWATVAGQGTLSGTSLTSSETWIGKVQP